MRRHGNRVVVALALVVVLPLIAAADAVRRGWGRRVALRAVAVVGLICGVRFHVRGADRLEPGRRYVFVPNHSSPLDIPAMLVARPDTRFAAAAELFAYPLLGPALRALGCVPIDRRQPRTARRQLADLARDLSTSSLVVFPEGGIAPAGQRLPFKSGAFMLAIDGRSLVVPVAITGTDQLMPPGARMALRPGTVVVELLEPLGTEGLATRDRGRLRDSAQTAVLAGLAAG